MNAPLEQYDFLICHGNCQEEEDLAHQICTHLREINNEVKVESFDNLCISGDRLIRMEEAIKRSSFIFVIITERLLNDNQDMFRNNTAIWSSITKEDSARYVVVYKDRVTMNTLKDVPSYIKVWHALSLEDMSKPNRRNALKKSIDDAIQKRKCRESEEERRCKDARSAADLTLLIDAFNQLKIAIQGPAIASRVKLLRLECQHELNLIKFAREKGIRDLHKFAQDNSLDVTIARVGVSHIEIPIEEGATGFSYDTLFGALLADRCEHVDIDEPHIKVRHQIDNFLRFCAVLVRSKCGVKTIALITHTQSDSAALTEIGENLQSDSVQLSVEYDENLHDRQIRFSSGWTVKIGRGLDIFQRPDENLSTGYFNWDLRPCKKTRVDFYYEPTK